MRSLVVVIAMLGCVTDDFDDMAASPLASAISPTPGRLGTSSGRPQSIVPQFSSPQPASA